MNDLVYKDCLGLDIKVGDYIAYSTASGTMQLGKVLELCTSIRSTWVPPAVTGTNWVRKEVKIPSLKIVGARKEYGVDGKFTKMNVSRLTKFENIIVINKNLPAIVVLI